jgi:CRISPR-associated protein Csm4
MSQYKIVRLEKFKGGLHLARGLTNAYDKSLETLHSDTLKSAIFVCALQLFPEIGVAGEKNNYQAGKDFLSSFKISSAFPFVKDNYYFPTPELPLPYNFPKIDGKEISAKKKAKVKFINKRLFKRFIQDVNSFEFTTDELNSNAVLTEETYKEIIKSETYQHVAIPRDYGSDSTPYYVDKLYFEEDAGLYFLLKTDDDSIFKKIEAALKLLADNGIGTDRNNGNGQFDIDTKSTMDLEFPADATHDLSLSLYCPKKEEIEGKLNDSYYELIKRGGYISSPKNETHLTVRKRSIHFFTAGSVFPKVEKRKGKIVNLKPKYDGLEHPIWRDGQAIFVPIKHTSNDG